jgi:hypothetical protein
VLRCTRCDREGTVGQVTAHTARGACHGAEVVVVSYPDGVERIVQQVSHAAVVTPAAPVPPPPSPALEDIVAAIEETGLPPKPETPDSNDDRPAIQDAVDASAAFGRDPDGYTDERWDEIEPNEPEDPDEPDVPAPPDVPDRRRTPRTGTAGDRPLAPPPFLEDAWRPVHLSPDSHVYYRIACTDPTFAERFGGNFRGTVNSFADDIIHAFFTLNLGYSLGLAPLPTLGDDADDLVDEDAPVTAQEVRAMLTEMLGRSEVSHARTADHAVAS